MKLIHVYIYIFKINIYIYIFKIYIYTTFLQVKWTMVPISSQTEEIGPASDGETIKMPITALKHLAQTNFKTNFFLPASTKDVSRKERSKQVCNRGFFVSTVFCKHRGDLCFHFFWQTQVSNPWRWVTSYGWLASNLWIDAVWWYWSSPWTHWWVFVIWWQRRTRVLYISNVTKQFEIFCFEHGISLSTGYHDPLKDSVVWVFSGPILEETGMWNPLRSR